MSKRSWTYIHKWALKVYHRITRGNYGTDVWRQKFKYFGKDATISWPSILTFGEGTISIGDKSVVKPNSRIENFSNRLNAEIAIKIGDRCDLGYYFTILNASKVTIGNDVLIASHVLITSENHGIDPESLYPYKEQPLTISSVSIGDGCWIGEKVCILPGVHIGKQCIIGAGSIVTKSIPDYSIAVGNPAKVIKKYNFSTHKWENVNNNEKK